jgi:glucosamine kinase
MSLFLAVDAGGTKTDYVLADETRELARVRTGTIKRMRTDAGTAAENLDSALAQLGAATGVSIQSVTRTCVGTAGVNVPLVYDWLAASFKAKVGGGLLIVGDVEIALDAAFPGQPGVLVLAGTGSNVMGRDHSGHLMTAGGWGPALSDQGSGHRIGQKSLRAIFMAIDEQRTTLLEQAVMDFWKLNSIETLVEYSNSVPPPDFSRLTSVVLQCAEQGDEVAKSVLREQGEELAYLVRLIIRRLRSEAKDAAWTPPIAYTGSILENVPPVRDALLAAIKSEFPTALAPNGVVDPIHGALWRARNGAYQ